MIEQRRFFRDAQRLGVPRHDDGTGHELDAAGQRGDVRQVDKVVGAERVILEMMLDHAHQVVAELVGKQRARDLLLVDLGVADVVVAETLRDLRQSDLDHGPPPGVWNLPAEYSGGD